MTTSITWEVRTGSGDLVTDLHTLASVLGADRTVAAKTLLGSPSHLVAPAALVAEARAQVKAKMPPKPGGGTPPPISTGSFVQWSGGRGRVTLVVTNGKVPGIDDDVQGTADSPACQVTVWEKDGDGWKATRKKIGAMAKTLKRIAPLQGKAARSAASATRLVELLAEHEESIEFDNLGTKAAVTGAAVKQVYDRGLTGWPGVMRTGLTRPEWAIERVKAFLDLAAGRPVPDRYELDKALLSKAHPMHPEGKAVSTVTPRGREGVDFVLMDPNELNAKLQELLQDE